MIPAVVSQSEQGLRGHRHRREVPLEFAGLGLSLKQQAAPLTFRVAQGRRRTSASAGRSRSSCNRPSS